MGTRYRIHFALAWSFALLTCANLAVAAEPSDGSSTDRRLSYAEAVLADQPVAYWRFDERGGKQAVGVNASSDSGQSWDGRLEGAASLGQAGPRPKFYPAFDADNGALVIDGKRGFVRVADPGDNSPLDFDTGDSITMEAWVNPSSLAHDRQVYIVGKGRTNNPGFERDNQNYALRLRGMDGTARVSFLFRSRGDEAKSEFHRWNSNVGFAPDGRWHHVAVTYTFGEPETIRGYVDGRLVEGTWDFAGPTTRPPVVDNDELWIGASMGGSSGNTFPGAIDELAIYRTSLPAEVLRSRYVAVVPKPPTLAEQMEEVPEGKVLVEIIENVPDRSWAIDTGLVSLTFDEPAFAFVQLPKKYTSDGIVTDRSSPYAIRARMKKELPAGEYRFLLRALNGARLRIDDRPVVETPFLNRNSSGHEAVPELTDPQYADMHPLAMGHNERLVTVELEAGMHLFTLEGIVGAKGARDEVGELCAAMAVGDEPFRLLTPDDENPISLSEDSWQRFVRASCERMRDFDRASRREATVLLADYWNGRHDWARQVVESLPPIPLPAIPAEMPAFNAIDRFIGAALAEADVQPTPLTDDFTFLRRVALDTIGVALSDTEIQQFLADERPDRRARLIDRLLDDPRWADNWVGYWQDVLAENPGILKAELNNTGPFRWWIYESLLDNKPMDQFVTELVMMKGSRYGGAPAGFAMATQNDAPMAEKAHVLAKAFLGVDLTCARCHDAPYHPYKQEELFGLAAMLDRKSIKLPASSTVPQSPGGRKPLVEISLKPGQTIAPAWAFTSMASSTLPEDALRDSADPREQLAAVITSPTNERFAPMLVNRVWHRYLGRGLVDPVDDWFEADPSHPELLDFLAREFLSHGYDWKHVARLILNSHTYQRQLAVEFGTTSAESRLFAAPQRRRLTAEQVVDSLFALCGKPMESEPLTLDPEGRRPATSFLNLGTPRRGWEFTSLSNERDRPALALPVAQSITDVLLAFGWRDARPNPLTVRETAPTVIQPLTLANGTVVNRVCQLSDNSELTEICLEDISLDEMLDRIYLRILGRPPADDERWQMTVVLADGFDDRRLANGTITRKPVIRSAVSWSNHLSAEATRIKLELEKAARAGDPPSGRLQADWRERMEDVVWALVNSPEFVFIP